MNVADDIKALFRIKQERDFYLAVLQKVGYIARINDPELKREIQEAIRKTQEN